MSTVGRALRPPTQRRKHTHPRLPNTRSSYQRKHQYRANPNPLSYEPD